MKARQDPVGLVDRAATPARDCPKYGTTLPLLTPTPSRIHAYRPCALAQGRRLYQPMVAPISV
jgi:hypothetical protein